MSFAYLMERYGFHILLFEDFIHSDIDDVNITDEERKQFIQDNGSTDVIFSQMRQYMAPFDHVVIPHITSHEQKQFIKQQGGLLIDVAHKQSFYHLIFSKSTSYFETPQEMSMADPIRSRQLVEKVS
jgi:hypothetical protein